MRMAVDSKQSPNWHARETQHESKLHATMQFAKIDNRVCGSLLTINGSHIQPRHAWNKRNPKRNTKPKDGCTEGKTMWRNAEQLRNYVSSLPCAADRTKSRRCSATCERLLKCREWHSLLGSSDCRFCGEGGNMAPNEECDHKSGSLLCSRTKQPQSGYAATHCYCDANS